LLNNRGSDNKNLKLSKPTNSVLRPKGSGRNKEFQIAWPEDKKRKQKKSVVEVQLVALVTTSL